MLRLSFVLAVFALLAMPAMAAPLTGVKTAELSAKLYAAGVAAGDPVLVIAAAKLRKPLAFRGEGAAPLGWEAMLAEAELLAVGDDALLGVIADVRAETSKGVSSGPLYTIGKLAQGGIDRFQSVRFAAGDYAEVYIEAQVETDLNLKIFDAGGRLVCGDSDPSPIAYCGWTAAEGGEFVMQVENLGPQDAPYALITN